MTAFTADQDEKLRHLRSFADTALGVEGWSLTGVGEAAEAELLANFAAVNRVYASLPPTSRDIIRDVTRRMGEGMAERLTMPLGQGTPDLQSYNLYCYAVAGLVGEGLTRLFVSRGFEDKALADGGELTWSFCNAPTATASAGIDASLSTASFGRAISMGPTL